MSDDIDLDDHSDAGPSNADGWMGCDGYLNANRGVVDPGSEYSDEGTAAHQVSDDCLLMGLHPFNFVGTTIRIGERKFVWSDDDAEQLVEGIEQIRNFGGKFYGEHKVNLSRWLGKDRRGRDRFGTLDRAVVLPDLIVIGDLKWGRGVPVSPVENKQLSLYALGFWQNVARHLTKATKFKIIIDQPRCSGGGGEWDADLDQLLAFGEEAKSAIIRNQNPEAVRTASQKGCLWCKRRRFGGGCDTYDEFNLDMMGFEEVEEIDTLDAICAPPPMTRRLTPERRSYIVRHKGMIEKWLEQIHADTINAFMLGEPTPGLKCVPGRRPPQKYTDKEEAEEVARASVGDHAFKSVMKTPTQLENELSEDEWAEIKPFVTRGSPKPVLVPEGDARPAIALVEHDFDEIEP